MATCDPQDVNAPFFDKPVVDNVPLALTPKGIEFLFEAIEDMVIEEGATRPEATQEEIAALTEAIGSAETWNAIDINTRRRVRRLLAHVAELMGVA